MITEELIELTHWILDKKTEQQDLEIKAANGGCPKRLYDTLSSFSNQDGGGILFFGVDETQNFRLVGVYDPTTAGCRSIGTYYPRQTT